jgi:shikimate kinase
MLPRYLRSLFRPGQVVFDVVYTPLESRGGTERPSLTGVKSFTDEVEEILDRRIPKYAAAAQYEVDTADLTPEQVADRVVGFWQRQ